MITQDGWLDWAKRDPGPADKRYSEPCTSEIVIPHSAVGYYNGWISRLKSTERNRDGTYTAYAAASVSGWIAYDGTVTQHYPLTVACWASGSRHLNVKGNAFECEGGFNPVNEPLTDAQVASLVRIIKDIGVWKGRPTSYWRRPTGANDLNATLYEHRETVRFGGAPTSCPSDRIPWGKVLAGVSAVPATPPATGKPYTDEEWGQAQWAMLNALQKYGMLRWSEHSTLRDMHPTDKQHVQRFLTWAVRDLAGK